MPSRRSDRGNKLKKQPGESDLDATNRKAMTAITLAPLFGLQGLGILAGAAGVSNDAFAKDDEKRKQEGVSPDSVDTITQLTDSILQSAAGHPFDFSITDSKQKQNAAREAIKMMMINGILYPDSANESSSPTDQSANKKKKEKSTTK